MISGQYSLDELSNMAQVALLQALQALAGAEAAAQNDRILVNLGSIVTVRVRVIDVSVSDESSLVHLAIQVVGATTGSEGIFDILAGIERNPHEAILSAVRKWIRYTFPPIRAAISNAETFDPTIGVTQLVARPDLQWKVYIGNALILGQQADTARVQSALVSEKSLFPGIVGDTVAARLDTTERRLHWVKLLVAFSNGSVVVECQFDNAEYPELDTLIAAQYKFPPLTGDFISLKQFVVIKPD